MDKNDFWTTVRNKGESGNMAAVGTLRAALLFGAVVIAVAIVVAPLLASRQEREMAASRASGFDTLTTGSISTGNAGTYTIRRSVTQPMPDALCIISADGTRRGAC